MLTASSKPAKKPRDLGHPLSVIITALAAFLVSQFVAAFVVEIALAVTGRGHGVSDLYNQSVAAQALFVLIAEGLAALSAIKLVKLRKLSLSFIGLGRKPNWRDLKYTAVGFAGFFLLLVIAGGLISLLLPSLNTNQPQNLGFNQLNGVGDSLLSFVALVLLPSLGEEPLVRGYLFGGLRARWKLAPALIVTSLLFGVAHLEFGNSAPLVWGAGIETFVLSIVLCYLREKSGALYAGIAVHMLNNLVAYSVHFHG